MVPAPAAALAVGRASAMSPSSRLVPSLASLRAPRRGAASWCRTRAAQPQIPAAALVAACSPAFAAASSQRVWHRLSSSSSTAPPSLSGSDRAQESAAAAVGAAAATEKSASPSEAVLERYRSRLDAKARGEGVADIESLRAAYADKITELRRRDAVVGAVAPEAAAAQDATASSDPAATSSTSSNSSSSSTSTSTSTSSTSSPSPSSSSRGARPLSSFIDLERSRALGAEELTAVWRLRFASDPHSLCAVIPAATYAAMEAAARARPQFVLPVPHPEQGAEVHFLQWTFDEQARSSTVLFTQLAEFKLRGEYAQPHTTVTHHTDLAADTGVVLMQGQVAADRGASADSARWLVMCLQRFYGAWAIPGTEVGAGTTIGAGTGNGSSAIDEGTRNRRMLLQWFAAGDPRFSIERLMDEVEKLG